MRQDMLDSLSQDYIVDFKCASDVREGLLQIISNQKSRIKLLKRTASEQELGIFSNADSVGTSTLRFVF